MSTTAVGIADHQFSIFGYLCFWSPRIAGAEILSGWWTASKYNIFHNNASYYKWPGFYSAFRWTAKCVCHCPRSFSKEYIGYFNHGSYTPFLDSLLQQGLCFTNAYSNEKSSNRELLRVTSGIPVLMEEPFYFFYLSRIISLKAWALCSSAWDILLISFYGANNWVDAIRPVLWRRLDLTDISEEMNTAMMQILMATGEFSTNHFKMDKIKWLHWKRRFILKYLPFLLTILIPFEGTCPGTSLKKDRSRCWK